MIVEKARAKLNFILNVGKKRGEKHELDTVIVPIELFDEVVLTKRSDGQVNISYDGVVDKYENDPAKRVAVRLVKTYRLPGVEIEVKKNIPEGAGLGGSSTDAAAVARGMERLFSFGKTEKEILTEAGSDVYAAYLDVPCRVRGTGEIAEPLPNVACPNVLILFSDFGVSTAECYKTFDTVGGEQGDVEKVVKSMERKEDFFPTNALTRAATILQPELKRALEAVKTSGLSYGMTGSGSAVFAFGYDKENFLKKVSAVGEYGRREILFRE